MKIYGINLAEGTQITNTTVATGHTFPNHPNEGELFYKVGQGLYVYNGSSWVLIGVENIGGYVFQQSTPSATWNIEHNLGTTNLQITTYVNMNDVLTTVLPQNITINDQDNITITFSTSYTGKVVITGVL